MKLPSVPPPWNELFSQHADDLGTVMSRRLGPEVQGLYEHWDHLRTSNPIESVFATVRHRTVRTKGALSQDTARLMVFKLVMAAARTWRRLKG